MLVQNSPLINENQPRVVALAAQYRLPAVYDYRGFVELGGLAFYGQDWRENFERAAALVDKILKGAKPADCRSSSRPGYSWWSISRPRRSSV
jgi:putative tryptophan/tyrosine transport system substrate-binding protein